MSTDGTNANNHMPQEFSELFRYIEVVKKSGFGEVRIIIKNGAIYRIQKTEDKIFGKE
jgi:hypothetical protein